MARRVLKYSFPIEDADQELVIGKILYVGSKPNDVDNIYAWAEEMLNPPVRYFRIFGTGHEIPTDARYIGTAINDDGLAWHLYERLN